MRSILLALLVAFALPLRAQAPVPNKAEGGKALTAESRAFQLTPITNTPGVDKTAVVIGVDDYWTLGKLHSCGKDAKAFARFLEQKMGFPALSIILMTDDADARRKPDRVNIMRVLRTFTANINENSEVVFFFSGHGVRDTNFDYLAPLDADAADVPETCISYNKLRDGLEGKTPRRCLMITDACRNILGKAAGEVGFGTSDFATEPQFAELRSCRPREKSQEMPDGSLGVFTNFLLKGLSGEAASLTPGNANITFDGLKRYVSGNTRQFVQANFEASQNPDGRASFGDMALIPANSPGTQPTLPNTQPVVPTTLPASPTVPTIPPVVQPEAPANPLVIRPQPSVVSPYEAKLPEVVPLVGELGIGSARINAKDGAKMVWVPAGEFKRGTVDANGWWNTRPVAQVYVDGFWAYETEVTVQQYRTFCEDTNRTMPVRPWGGSWNDNHPIVNVSWDDANAYAKWANASLPTEAQWEKAARGTDGRTYPWGSTFDMSRLWCSVTQIMDAGFTAPVGSFPSGKSPYGCLDMAGNAEEWCSDWYADYYYQTSPLRNPTGPLTGTDHATRGGSWYRFESDGAGGWFKCAMRRKSGYGTQDIGFRCVQNP